MQECATALISPDGECVAAGPLHDEALVLPDLDPAAATGYLARRFAPDRYREEPAGWGAAPREVPALAASPPGSRRCRLHTPVMAFVRSRPVRSTVPTSRS
ncbi:MAG TPA: hypothetical protein VL691_15180, partial [Vicinamibacteria bacterium]|nr:hypothetical protein [Vicinamibacteria bacterium]